MKEATARIKINKLLEAGGCRFFLGGKFKAVCYCFSIFAARTISA